MATNPNSNPPIRQGDISTLHGVGTFLLWANIQRFDAAIPEYYSAETRARGYSIVTDRRGKPFRAPIASVAIAIITNEQRVLEHPLQVATLAAEVKKRVKSQRGSHFAFDRRHK